MDIEGHEPIRLRRCTSLHRSFLHSQVNISCSVPKFMVQAKRFQTLILVVSISKNEVGVLGGHCTFDLKLIFGPAGSKCYQVRLPSTVGLLPANGAYRETKPGPGLYQRALQRSELLQARAVFENSIWDHKGESDCGSETIGTTEITHAARTELVYTTDHRVSV